MTEKYKMSGEKVRTLRKLGYSACFEGTKVVLRLKGAEHGSFDDHAAAWRFADEAVNGQSTTENANSGMCASRERFQKWVLSIEHPVLGWLDEHWLKRGDNPEWYANDYVQGLWVAFKAFSSPPANQQGELVGEIVAFGHSLHEVSWSKGRMPKLGAKLYCHENYTQTKAD
ncbi:hypothetical protein RYA05_03365 [Pseudomonas syringae pv. actinidiae]|nr:hypothetical protein [Pseudomonas syringae pv. actinidiae]